MGRVNCPFAYVPISSLSLSLSLNSQTPSPSPSSSDSVSCEITTTVGVCSHVSEKENKEVENLKMEEENVKVAKLKEEEEREEEEGEKEADIVVEMENSEVKVEEISVKEEENVTVEEEKEEGRGEEEGEEIGRMEEREKEEELAKKETEMIIEEAKVQNTENGGEEKERFETEEEEERKVNMEEREGKEKEGERENTQGNDAFTVEERKCEKEKEIKEEGERETERNEGAAVKLSHKEGEGREKGKRREKEKEKEKSSGKKEKAKERKRKREHHQEEPPSKRTLVDPSLPPSPPLSPLSSLPPLPSSSLSLPSSSLSLPPPSHPDTEADLKHYDVARLELWKSEETYRDHLEEIVRDYYLPLYSSLPADHSRLLFGNISQVLSLSVSLSHSLSHWWRHGGSLAKIFDDIGESLLTSLTVYCDNYETKCLRHFTNFVHPKSSQFRKSSFLFMERLREINSTPLLLQSKLIMPIQRVPRYLLLIKEIVRYSGHVSSDVRKDLDQALALVTQYAATLNSAMESLKLKHSATSAALALSKKYDNGDAWASELENAYFSIQMDGSAKVIEMMSPLPSRESSAPSTGNTTFTENGSNFQETNENIFLFGSRLIRSKGDGMLRKRMIQQVVPLDLAFQIRDNSGTQIHIVSPFHVFLLSFVSSEEMKRWSAGFCDVLKRIEKDEKIKSTRVQCASRIVFHDFESHILDGERRGKKLRVYWMEDEDGFISTSLLIIVNFLKVTLCPSSLPPSLEGSIPHFSFSFSPLHPLSVPDVYYLQYLDSSDNTHVTVASQREMEEYTATLPDCTLSLSLSFSHSLLLSLVIHIVFNLSIHFK